MELINHTSFPARIFRTGITEETMGAALIAKLTYDIVNGEAKLADEHTWPVEFSSWESEYGIIEGDNAIQKGGVDVLVFGNALSKFPVEEMDLSVEIQGKFRNTLKVFGDRIWERDTFGIRPSEPVPFTKIPIRMENAFGGWGEWDSLSFPDGQNPHGKGFYWEEDHAIGNPLPNIENPGQLIHQWSDRPDPAGFGTCPLTEFRIRGHYEPNEEGLTKISPGLFNVAFPAMVTKNVMPGDRVIVCGMSIEPRFEFSIPDSRLICEVKVGEKHAEKELVIDQVGIIPEKRQLFLTYRYPFSYTMRPRENRSISLFFEKITISL